MVAQVTRTASSGDRGLGVARRTEREADGCWACVYRSVAVALDVGRQFTVGRLRGWLAGGVRVQVRVARWNCGVDDHLKLHEFINFSLHTSLKFK